jgi:hypothetical protein
MASAGTVRGKDDEVLGVIAGQVLLDGALNARAEVVFKDLPSRAAGPRALAHPAIARHFSAVCRHASAQARMASSS